MDFVIIVMLFISVYKNTLDTETSARNALLAILVTKSTGNKTAQK